MYVFDTILSYVSVQNKDAVNSDQSLEKSPDLC